MSRTSERIVNQFGKFSIQEIVLSENPGEWETSREEEECLKTFSLHVLYYISVIDSIDYESFWFVEEESISVVTWSDNHYYSVLKT